MLQTATPALFDRYTEYLVWAMVSLGENGRPISCPHQTHVHMYDSAIRKRVADHMNSGIDIRDAFAEATAHEPTRQTHFYGVIQCDTRPRSVTAPGLSSAVPAVDLPQGPKGAKATSASAST